ncbi:MAG: flavodoxin family protein [Desulfobacterales bacterium]|nr:flavodoxin family protein [Desulfobacterales bacterium]
MKTLVTYYSQSGNTEKLAKAIYDGLSATQNEIEPISDSKTFDEYDIIFVGFPVQNSSVPSEAEKCLKRIPDGKMLAIFGTHGSLRGGPLAITAFHYAMTLAVGATIIGTFGCRGEVKASLLETLMNKAEYKFWALEAQSAEGHPDAADLEDGQNFAKLMVQRAGQLY